MTHLRIVLLLTFGAALTAHAQVRASFMLADMEGDLSQYRGVARDTDLAKEGDASARWDRHATNRSAILRGIPTDWSGFDNLEFWLRSAKANRAQFMLIIRSENDQTDGMDYWSRKLTADWTGWRRVRIPLKRLGAGARKPRGWHEVDYVYFTAHGWSCEPKSDTVIHIDDVKLTNDACRVAIVRREARPDYSNLP